jgi:stromal membrane-associated protein
VYEALLSDNFRRPQTDSGLESFIRSKYEQKKYIAREWIPPPPITKVDWDKEIEEELENQKRKKKSATVTTTTIPEPAKSAPSPVANAIPAPLPKPHSPKTSRLDAKKISTAVATISSTTTTTSSNHSMDLLGLETSTPSILSTPASTVKKPVDSFDFFSDISSSSSPPAVAAQTVSSNSSSTGNSINGTSKNNNSTESSLKQEEDDFFNQKTLENGTEKGKLTKDSILALYGQKSAHSYTPPQVQPFNANFQQYPQDQFFTYGQQPGAPLFKPVAQAPFMPPASGQPPQMFSNNGNFGNFVANFGGIQSQQINQLNEANIKKIESLNFGNFK